MKKAFDEQIFQAVTYFLSFDVFSTFHHSIDLFHLPTLMHNSFADPSSRPVYGVRLRPLACCDRGFKSHWRHGCLFVVSVVCCQVEVSATDWSLVQRSPTDCGASLCVIKKSCKQGGYSPARGMQNTNPQWVVAPVEKNKAQFLYSLTIRMLHYNRRHVSSINMPIFRRTAEQSALIRHTVQPFTESGDTRCYANTICPPEDVHVNTRNTSKIVK
jgi:hypothetical protein